MSTTATEAKRAAGRIPSLDGLRAVSIAFVMLSHLNGTRGFPPFESVVEFGNLGVRVFFVISGFLITRLLLAEYGTTGRIDLKQFYIRRFFRIFPAFYVFIAVVALLGVMGFLEVSRADVLHAATYTTNYYNERGWNLGHTWSLAVEEQFYLLWPFALVLVPRRYWAVVALGWMILGPVARVLLLALPDGTSWLQTLVGFSFETTSDAIAAGCLLALMESRLAELPLGRLITQRGTILGIIALGLSAATLNRWHGMVSPRVDFFLAGAHAAVGITTLNICIGLLIWWATRPSTSAAFRVLNFEPIAYFGRLSYSLYLWQQLFLNRNSPHLWTTFPANLGLAVLAAYASYTLIEQPALRLRARLGSRGRAVLTSR